jgi:hypothetical protein
LRLKLLIVYSLILLAIGAKGQAILLQKPTKGDIWAAFSIQRIQWSSSNIDNIKLESSLDSGRSWNTIVASYPASAGYYDWEVPNFVSDSCYIRVSDILNPTTSSSNFKNNPFIIPKPSLTLDSTGNQFFSKTSIPVSWTFSGVKKINIYISYGNTLQFQKIADSVPANNGYYNLILKDTAINNCYLKIEDLSNPGFSDTLNAPFSIIALPNNNLTKFKGGFYDGHSTTSNRKTELLLISPNKKDSLIGSKNYTIRWKEQNIEKIKIEYSNDGGNNWNTIASNLAASANEYAWLVPNMPTDLGKIKITNISDSTIFDESDSTFIIRKKELKLNLPRTLEPLKKNTSFPISWSSIGVSKLKIKIVGGTSNISDSISADNEVFNWIVAHQPDSFRIIIQDISDSSVSDTSSFLKIVDLPIPNNQKFKGGNFDGHTVLSNVKSSIKISNLNSRQIFATQSKIEIKWNAVNIEKVSAYLSIDSLKSWHLLSSSINANAGRYILQLPNVVAENCYIKLVSESDSNTTAISDSSFTLISKRLTNTTDTVNWFVGLTKILSWEQVGVDTISISYKTKNSNSWTLLNNKYPSSGEIFNWVIPTIFDSLWVKLNDIVDTGVVSITSYHNKIKSNNIPPGNLTKYRGGFFDGHSFRSSVNKIIINRPNSNEVVIGGSAYSINWSTINISDSVLLEFSIDSGKTWITIGKVIATNGSYIWNIPSSITKSGNLIFDTAGISKENTSSENTISINSQNCLIRALDPYNNNEIVGISNKTFTIKTSETKLVNKIVFQKPLNLIWPENSKQKLIAQASSGRTVTVIIEKGDAAKIIADSIFATKSGKITIAAFDLGDNNFEKSDTVRYEICINPTKPVANNISICNSTTVGPLSAIVSSGNTLLWYASNENSAISSTSPPVPSLSNIGITNFFVSQISKDGCESEKEKISVEIKVTPSSPSILRDNEGYLISNKFGNTWYKEDVKISDTTQKIRPSTNGYYSATSTQNGCISTMSEKFYYLTTAIQGLDINEYLRISPNPTRGYITINFKISNYNEIGFKLIDVTGKTIIPLQKLKTGSKMSLTNIISGSYILIAYNKDGVIIKTERIIKQ